jgi:hypothetical protein
MFRYERTGMERQQHLFVPPPNGMREMPHCLPLIFSVLHVLFVPALRWKVKGGE